MSQPSAEIVLASTSPYRRELLGKLGITFTQIDPAYKETELPGESPDAKALRLARGKAKAGAVQRNSPKLAVILGSDQVAHCEQRVLSKPGHFQKAKEQLQFCSGKWVRFSTAVSLVDTSGQELGSFVDTYDLRFRVLSDLVIEHYLHLDQPYDCAGSIKAEQHGILLIEESAGQDIHTLYGLPLIKLTSLMSQLGLIHLFR